LSETALHSPKKKKRRRNSPGNESIRPTKVKKIVREQAGLESCAHVSGENTVKRVVVLKTLFRKRGLPLGKAG